ncbi:XdhC family aldehyde oxidoreductase maturation factor [Desulfospira joergensenii]|uniref:XdhC family aldehyde oxidoreductase maturation factor n=1 Tax=Desulfospira joergensenii TaxID=53329 RepID=UPI0003B66CE9|nr:XdhC/CoxI family protein [Desulfospira joergensenii]
MEALNKKILECLTHGTAFSLATIMTHKGSTPRTSGSKMIVLRDRTLFGTIGGGLVEARTIETCLASLENKSALIREFNLDNELKTGLDMVCGGHLTVLIEPFLPLSNGHDPELISLFRALADLEAKGEKAFLISRITGFSQKEFSTRKCLVKRDGTPMGAPLVPKALLDEISDNQFTGSFPSLISIGLEEFIVEPVLPRDTLFIFGAGHVGFQLARTARIADFQSVVVDDRKEFANPSRFPHARLVEVIDDFSRAFENLEVDENSFIVITTRGHLHDQTVLAQALETKAAYIGMIGSRPKRDKIYTNLKNQGVSQESLDRVFSPIGLDIHSETPGEIAVSIMAQIIRERGMK